MPQTSIDSQFADMEALADDEHGVPVDATTSTKAIVRAAIEGLSPRRAEPTRSS